MISKRSRESATAGRLLRRDDVDTGSWIGERECKRESKSLSLFLHSRRRGFPFRVWVCESVFGGEFYELSIVSYLFFYLYHFFANSVLKT